VAFAKRKIKVGRFSANSLQLRITDQRILILCVDSASTFASFPGENTITKIDGTNADGMTPKEHQSFSDFD